MSAAGGHGVDNIDLALSVKPAIPAANLLGPDPTEEDRRRSFVAGSISGEFDDGTISPEDLRTLRRVAGNVPIGAYSIAFVELCERFSYYGTTVVFTNFIQQPLPPGSTTGANHGSEDYRSGAFGKGQQAAFAATTFNGFWAYFMPIIGAYVADEFLGRFNTIQYAIIISIIGHVILLCSAVPSVIVKTETAWGIFWLGLVIMGIGTGGFKSNISPLVAEQVPATRMKIKTLKSGERVIEDPAITIQRVYLWFYLFINTGAAAGQVSMVYAEQNVGFWLSFSLPTILFSLTPMILFACKKQYRLNPPTGSVVAKCFRLWWFAAKGKWSINPVTTVKNMQAQGFWDNVKPSKLGDSKPAWMNFDDAWVDEVARGFKACEVFFWLPLYWLTYNQTLNNTTSQAATLRTGGVPNDLIQNINPIALVVFIPIVDQLLYPYLRKKGIRFSAIKRIFGGFMFGALGMLSACLIQWAIYKYGPSQCGKNMNTCRDILDELGLEDVRAYADISVWVQIPIYLLIAFSEILASVTGLEYAFTKAPKNMRSLVMSINLFTTAFASALGQAFTPLADDPLLVWNYGSVAIIAFVAGILFLLLHRDLDKADDKLNMLPSGTIAGKRGLAPENDEERNGSYSGSVTHEVPAGDVKEKDFVSEKKVEEKSSDEGLTEKS